jgi:transcriptional antiterminator RfaH
MPFWSTARTLCHREAFACERLTANGFETFLPMIHAGPKRVAPLFAGYIFVLIHDQWRAVDRTLGVLKLVRFGDCPARVPDREIDELRARMDPSTGVVRLPPPPSPKRRAFAKGDKVKIVGGPFAGVAALHTGLSASQREIVLLQMLGGQRQVAVPAHLVEARQ